MRRIEWNEGGGTALGIAFIDRRSRNRRHIHNLPLQFLIDIWFDFLMEGDDQGFVFVFAIWRPIGRQNTGCPTSWRTSQTARPLHRSLRSRPGSFASARIAKLFSKAFMEEA
jgi:hypothetical protein